MCRVAQQHFPDDPAAVSPARLFVGVTLRRWDLGALVPDGELAVSEMLTNAMVHARPPIVVMVCVTEGITEIVVTDSDPRTPRLRPQRRDLLADLDALPLGIEDHADPRHPGLRYGPSGSIAAGRGLIILDAISTAWGVRRHDHGKDVWARLAVPTAWPHLSACTCRQSTGRMSASGLPLHHLEGAWDVA
ncbi:hypothetical protein acdb102_07320 [Acidothermaceae bacterium B102]|nr:hypothetical protein acdb102_07320 [Acidothermaceae bacterium B102]